MDRVEETLTALKTALDAGMGLESVVDLFPPDVARSVGPAIRSGTPVGRAFFEAHLIGRGERALLDVGEETGSLPMFIGEVLAARTERRQLVRKAMAALIYPTLVVVLASFILPLPTLISDGSSAYASRALPLPLVLLSVVVAILLVGRAPRGRTRVNDAALQVAASIPFARGVVRQAATASFFRALGRMLTAGLGVARALRIANEVVSPSSVLGDLSAALETVERGGTLTDAMKSLSGVSAAVVRRVNIGERTGTWDRAFLDIAKEAEEDAKRGRTRIVVVITGGIFFFALAFVAFGIFTTAKQTIIDPLERALDVSDGR